jgi:tetratricopeptide (TPR) repeat protein
MATPNRWQRLLSRIYFVWGQSCTYWGHRLLSQRTYRWAVGSYTRAHELDPAWGRPLLRRGMIRGRELDDYAGAIRDLTDAMERQPDWAEPYLQRGLLHAFHGFVSAQRAIDDFERFLALAPAHSWREEAEHQIQRLRADIAERELARKLDR